MLRGGVLRHSQSFFTAAVVVSDRPSPQQHCAPRSPCTQPGTPADVFTWALRLPYASLRESSLPFFHRNLARHSPRDVKFDALLRASGEFVGSKQSERSLLSSPCYHRGWRAHTGRARVGVKPSEIGDGRMVGVGQNPAPALK